MIFPSGVRMQMCGIMPALLGYSALEQSEFRIFNICIQTDIVLVGVLDYLRIFEYYLFHHRQGPHQLAVKLINRFFFSFLANCKASS